MRVWLSGPMGSGKSTVAALVARRLGYVHVDLDARVEEHAGRSVAELFAEQGEAAFRSLERAEALAVLADPADCVVALGGGAVCDAELRRKLLFSGIVVTLMATPAELARRVGTAQGRPLLAGDSQAVVSRLERLLAERRPAYAECHACLDTGGRTSADVASLVLEVVGRAPLVVPLGERTYTIDVGPGCLAGLPLHLSQAGVRGKVVLVTDRNVAANWGPRVQSLLATEHATELVVLEPGEHHKTLASVELIWRAALDAGVDREAMLVGLGGGVVGDLCGFAASTLLRGVALAHVPTTLLAMVDSAIGGKTGFDTAHGKNLVGTFYQPRFVLSDIETLASLPVAERTSGLAEVVKSAWLAGEAAVAALEADAALLCAGEPDALQRAIRMAAQLKARIVTLDERESGPRALLNLGHTVGHAIEASAHYQGLRHGEAVALGMIAAFRVARALGQASLADAERMLHLLKAMALPTELAPHLSDATFAFMGSDKKRGACHIRYVVPGAPGQAEQVSLAVQDIARMVLGQ